MANTGITTKECMEIDRKQPDCTNPGSGVNDNAPAGNVLAENIPADNAPAGGQPRIAVLMAVYEPRPEWLEEQLRSLDRQTILDPPAPDPDPAASDLAAAGRKGAGTCPVKLYIRDDASRNISVEAIRACAERTLRRLPFEFAVNPENRGSSAVFQQLVTEAEGEWFAFCDQDDIWEPDKLEKELRLAEERNAALVCSDLRMIDAEGCVLADSITDLRPRHRFADGSGLAGRLIYRNFATGCTILMRADVARQAVPFAESMVHDHYLAFFSALWGDIASCPEALVRYRQHDNNQTGVLYRITSKQEYLDLHLAAFAARSEELYRRFGDEEPELERARRWCAAREKNAARQPGGMRALWALRHVNLSTSLFELICLRLPEPLFRLALKWIQAGKI